MSWEAWGSGPEPPDTDAMARHGWEFDTDMKMARRDDGEWIPIADAIEAYEDWLADADY